MVAHAVLPSRVLACYSLKFVRTVLFVNFAYAKIYVRKAIHETFLRTKNRKTCARKKKNCARKNTLVNSTPDPSKTVAGHREHRNGTNRKHILDWLPVRDRGPTQTVDVVFSITNALPLCSSIHRTYITLMDIRATTTVQLGIEFFGTIIPFPITNAE